MTRKASAEDGKIMVKIGAGGGLKRLTLPWFCRLVGYPLQRRTPPHLPDKTVGCSIKNAWDIVNFDELKHIVHREIMACQSEDVRDSIVRAWSAIKCQAKKNDLYL